MYRPYNIYSHECHTHGHMSVPCWNICIQSYSQLTSTRSCVYLCCMCSCCSQLDNLKYFNHNRCTSVEHQSHILSWPLFEHMVNVLQKACRTTSTVDIFLRRSHHIDCITGTWAEPHILQHYRESGRASEFTYQHTSWLEPE